MSIPGQPYNAVCTFTATGAPFDPTEVKASLTATNTTPPVTPTVLRYGVDGSLTKLSTGVYQVAFVPTQFGDWSVTFDGFDGSGIHVGAATSVVTIDRRPAVLASA